ncbi:hypothetical protein B0H66DRAFT_542127 [Apodospora peruviana]|uniref:C2H2-type domain-containing protein n=1 Tax=Apodospora peruviana TaxID=516989 RepID=A0AAE0ISM2_9PEZI|nr:hypothetical protein B0H66DRAFT_542127 [Apodospora peruviana]
MPSSDTLDHIVVKPKRFQCHRCQRLFARLEHLQRHERTHTQERPFFCSQCESRFTRSDLLIRHERLSHNRDRGEAQQQPQQTKARESDSHNSSHPQRASKRPKTSAGMTAGLQRPQETPLVLQPSTPSLDPSESTSEEPVQDDGSPGGFNDGSPTHQAGPELESHDDHQPSPTAFMLDADEGRFLQDGELSLSTFSPTPLILTCATPVENPTDAFVGSVAQPDNILPSIDVLDPRQSSMYGDFNGSPTGFTAFLETGAPSSYCFTSLVTAEQPVPFFSFDSFLNSDEAADGPNLGPDHANVGHELGGPEEPNSFSRFGSRLPSIQPEENPVGPVGGQKGINNRYGYCDQETRPKRILSDMTSEDRQFMLDKISEFGTVPPHFRLPTRLSLARYIRAYIDGFHEHLPFLHIPSMSIQSCSVELLLAMAAVGAQYCFEAEKGVELFNAARAIATERIRRRDARIASAQREDGYDELDRSAGDSTVSASNSPPVAVDGVGSLPDANSRCNVTNGPLGLPSSSSTSILSTTIPSSEENLMQSAQALLILMAMATWAKHKEILREALAIQSILGSLVRDDGLRSSTTDNKEETETTTWEAWIRSESVLRTKYIVFCFFNLHSIVYDIPPLILNSELGMRLPCSAAEFKADTPVKWQEIRRRKTRAADPDRTKPAQFQDALRALFSRDDQKQANITDGHSSLGNYILIHAIVQHIFLVRQTARGRFDSSSDNLTPEDVAPLEQALRNWQLGWERSPESSLDPMDRHWGHRNSPVSFNSTALLRLAYIRLSMNAGPGRLALGTRDPLQIARALRDAPAVKRTPKLAQALLHSAHALSIPVKIGVRLVARTQMFMWSIQHSLCSLECALLLSKWLEAVATSVGEGEPQLTEDERKILMIVRTMLGETEFAVPEQVVTEDLRQTARYLNAGVLRVWATIFRGSQTWAIVDVIGSALNTYADMLEAAT